MSVKVEQLDTKNMSKMTVTVDAKELDSAIKKAYDRTKNRISIRGFRKGHVPMKVVEQIYGDDVFYEDAANILINQEYPKAYDESGLIGEGMHERFIIDTAKFMEKVAAK